MGKAFCLTHNCWTSLKKLTRAKRSRLLSPNISDDGKKFYIHDCKFVKTFSNANVKIALHSNFSKKEYFVLLRFVNKPNKNGTNCCSCCKNFLLLSIPFFRQNFIHANISKVVHKIDLKVSNY